MRMLVDILLLGILCFCASCSSSRYGWYQYKSAVNDTVVHAIMRIDNKDKLIDYYIGYSESSIFDNQTFHTFSYIYICRHESNSNLASLKKGVQIIGVKISDIEVYNEFNSIDTPIKCFNNEDQYKLYITENKTIEDYNIISHVNMLQFLGDNCIGNMLELLAQTQGQYPLILKKMNYKNLYMYGPATQMFEKSRNSGNIISTVRE